MSEPTKKEMKRYLKFWHKECIPDKDNEPCESCPEDVRDRCLEVEDAILALIEHGPEVDEETLESLLGERSLYGIIRYLRQKGVTVKEAQNQNEIYQDEGPGLQEEGDK